MISSFFIAIISAFHVRNCKRSIDTSVESKFRLRARVNMMTTESVVRL